MLFGQLAARHRFIEPLRSNRCLETVERVLRAEIAAILENVRSGIALGIVYALVHRRDDEGQPYLLMMAARRCAGEAPRRSSALKVLFMSRVRCSPSIALIFSKPAKPMVSRCALARGRTTLPRLAFPIAFGLPTFFMESS